ncbi:CDP-glycerol glycerophosphotransferase family protein [Priestia megaterium]|uniref:CDP-glycerol glycerophosphotransferase family protein n=1 Tax=Priestia megaterium TaxID=1404 RepID=UPI001C248F02|nr:CDP-glycerol glycerophosphotransferase family protein [Priestia megaterium]MBU8752340.1 CDP-glycerol glycerophosphotransferase family protein [Priestia megaterium]
MKVSIIALLHKNNVKNFAATSQLLKQQTIGYENIELVIVDELEAKSNQIKEEIAALSQDPNVRVVEDVQIEELSGEYVSFLDWNYQLKPDMYLTLVQTAKDSDMDFVSANEGPLAQARYHEAHFVINNGLSAVTSLKVLKKEVLLKLNVGNHIDSALVKTIDFILYSLPTLSFSFLGELTYKNQFSFDEDYVYQESIDARKIIEQAPTVFHHDFDEEVEMVLVQHLMNLIDKKLFTDDMVEQKQTFVYETLRMLTKNLTDDEFTTMGLGGYNLFLNMIKKGLDHEATEYIKLLRSKRHWYTQTKKYQTYFKKHPHNLEKSLSWKITKPLRTAYRLYNAVRRRLVKYTLLASANVVRLFLSNKKVWLVGEREDQAEDNGYFFFKYCREHYPNEKIYYVINQDSPHLDRVEKYGNVIYHSSWKHKIYMLVANTYISAWAFEECSYPRPKQQFINMFKKKLETKKNVSLQHGVIIHNIAPYLHKERYNQDLIISSSDYEKKIIMNTLGYEEDEVAVTGLARFDNLHDISVKKQILIMPTWRRHLFKINKNQFLKSDYYKAYRDFIQNPAFLDLIERHNIPVKFYIHSQMQKFMSHFIIEHPNIEFLVKSTATVSELLKESALLVTDYSSVSSDFLYMNKPVVMYQFDPHNNHHSPVEEIKYSDLGTIVSTEEQLVDAVTAVVENDFKAEQQYINNSNRIFKYKDRHNAERIYQAISEKTS